MNRITATLAALSVPAVRSAIKAAAEFEQAIDEVRRTAEEAGEDTSKMEAEARELAETTTMSITDACYEVSYRRQEQERSQ